MDDADDNDKVIDSIPTIDVCTNLMNNIFKYDARHTLIRCTKRTKKRKRSRTTEMEAGRIVVMERRNSSHCALQNAATSSNVKLANLMKLCARLELHWSTTNYWQREKGRERGRESNNSKDDGWGKAVKNSSARDRRFGEGGGG